MRKLASIQKIIAIEPIPKADAIEVATILGWKVVVKKNSFKVNDLVVYFEVDSMLPKHKAFEFLGENCWKEKEQAYRIRTIVLRGQISQGLVIPPSELSDIIESNDLYEGKDLTREIGVFKYEPTVPAEISGDAKSFSWPIPKTDEIRIQTMPKFLEVLKGKSYYTSSKLDGTSSSFILDVNNEYHVCGHNYSFVEKEGNTFWELSKKYNIKDILESEFKETGTHYALQGEVCGPGIQKNKLGLSTHDVFFFNLIDVDSRKVLPLEDLVDFCYRNKLNMVPIIEMGDDFSYFLEEILKKAEGLYIDDGFESARPKQEREGIVVRSSDSAISFKVISNKFLIGKDNDD